MIISGIQKTTLIDYSDKVAATVFLSGCNFRCPWCYSAELVLPEKIKDQPILPEEKFFEFLRKRQGLLDAIVLCGGEPTINSELPEFIKKIKKLGFLVKLDTNGSNPEMLKSLIDDKLIDYVAMDIKLPKERYSEVFFSEIEIEDIQKSIDILKEHKIPFEFRTTVAPEALNKEALIQMANWIAGPEVTYYLQNFRAEKTIDPKFEELKPYHESYLEEVVKEISSLFKICEVR